MIANFYKFDGNCAMACKEHYTLIISKNIDCIPKKGTFVALGDQTYVVSGLCLDLDMCEYNIILETAKW